MMNGIKLPENSSFLAYISQIENELLKMVSIEALKNALYTILTTMNSFDRALRDFRPQNINTDQSATTEKNNFTIKRNW